MYCNYCNEQNFYCKNCNDFIIMKTEVDKRVIQCIEYLVGNEKYKSEAEFLRQFGFPEGKLSNARRGNAGFRADDIAKILMNNEQLNGHWIMTGKGDMLLQPGNSISNSSFILQEYNQLKQENRELIEEVGKLKERIEQLKKDNARWDIAAESADASPYGLAK